LAIKEKHHLNWPFSFPNLKRLR